MAVDDCAVQTDLAAFVDGELRGHAVLRVLGHLEHCARCADEVAALRALGEAIRGGDFTDAAPADLDGLAGTVISRTRAEAAESWSGVFRRAQEDLHWVVVGAGAVAATFVSTLLLSAILAFGPKPDRQDSISAYYTNSRSPAGPLYLLATPLGHDQEPVLVPVDEGVAHAPGDLLAFANWQADRSRAEAALVNALQDAVTDGGLTVALETMNPERRRYTESLLEEISRLRTAGPLPRGVALAVHEVRLIASASVTVKGL
jgi:hypothetical protein